MGLLYWSARVTQYRHPHRHTGWLKIYYMQTIIIVYYYILLQYISSFRLINITTFFKTNVFYIDAHLLICAKCWTETHSRVSAALSETWCHSCSVRLYSSRCHSSEEKAEAQDTYYGKITKISEWHCWQTLGHTEPRRKLEENGAVTHCCPCGIWAVTPNITSISGQSDWWMGKMVTG